MRIKRRLPPTLLPTLLLGFAMSLAAAGARADIYGYIDSDGNAHFAATALDSRYRLFMHGNDALFDTAKLGMGSGGANAGNSLGGAGRVGKARGAGAGPLSSPLVNYLASRPNLKKYEAMVNRAAAEFTLDPALLKAIMAAESGFNPDAVSPKGAVGLMQIMPATAQRYGMQADKKRSLQQKLSDPALNIHVAARYLRDLKQLFPQRPDLSVAAYNAGEGAVQKYRNQIPPYPETQNYVQLVTQFYRLYAPGAGGASGAAGAEAPTRITMILPGAGRRNLPAPRGPMRLEGAEGGEPVLE